MYTYLSLLKFYMSNLLELVVSFYNQFDIFFHFHQSLVLILIYKIYFQVYYMCHLVLYHVMGCYLL